MLSADGSARCAMQDGGARSAVPVAGLLQLLASVILLSSARPFTKVALSARSLPLWFAERRAVLSGMTAFALPVAMRRIRLPARADWPAVLAIGGLQLGGYFALADEAVARVPAVANVFLGEALIVGGVGFAIWPERRHR